MDIKIIIENEDLIAPLYTQYPGQCNPQPAYIEIDPSGDLIAVSASININIGSGCSQAAFTCVVNQISCPCYVLGSELKNYLYSDKFSEKCLAMCAGYKCDWDGNNYRGFWNQNVFSIEEDIRMDLLNLGTAEIYDGDDWISESITFYNDLGEKVNSSNSAIRAVYDETCANLEVTNDNIDVLVEAAEKYIDRGLQLVEDLEGAFYRIIEEIEYNKE